MAELNKNYTPQEIENQLYKNWIDKQYFKSTPDQRKPYTIVIPPPNVTGVLHMGHTLNETIQDILIRRARMQGFNACWVPGSDHASIATEAKVVDMLKKEKNIDKQQLSRSEFLQYAFEWKDKYGGIIYEQIKKLGCSVDWDRTTFTMDDHYYEAVIKIFVQLYQEGLIYRGARMINWDPIAKTALSDEEVEYKEVESTMYHLQYEVEDGSLPAMIVATQRPETIMGDVAVCVNPNDERYKKYVGKKVRIPLIQKAIPIITDEYVTMDFGTGALKITPAHDINDYQIGLKYNLPVVNILNEDGTISNQSNILVGVERFEARKQILAMLKEKNLIVKEESNPTRIGYSQRTQVIVEPRISTQWFLKMDSLARLALDAVNKGGVNLHPQEKFINTYNHWLENIQNWCISRQLWWGQRIPAWYDKNKQIIVAHNEDEAYQKYSILQGKDASILKQQNALFQDEDCLDTWFSSWIFPQEVFYGISNPNNTDFKYYYPTTTLVTGQDIIFFWVARMIMSGMYFNQQVPFKDVYFTGMVRDKQGRKMSKSLGNSPDLLMLIDKYGADSVRFGIMIASPAGNDLLFDESSLEQGRNFTNKLWNAFRLISMWDEKQQDTIPIATTPHFAIQWFKERLSAMTLEIEEDFKNFKLSEALKKIYTLIWDDFCSVYLEWIKPPMNHKLDSHSIATTQMFFVQQLQLLHPFLPFITEYIYQEIKTTNDAESISISTYPSSATYDKAIVEKASYIQTIITAIRELRVKNKIKNAQSIDMFIITPHQQMYDGVTDILQKQLNIKTLQFVSQEMDSQLSLAIEKDKFFVACELNIDTTAQREELLKDLEYQKNFLAMTIKKLDNQRFIQNAKPEVIAIEQKKKTDAENRIQTIKEALSAMH